ncbi:MAG: anhydro-N-acetylmuramic acid kinase [Candidatus Bathyarchaeia archaeon]
MAHPSFMERLREKKTRRIIGLMSGTSADGVSAAIVEVEGHGLETNLKLVTHRVYPYPPNLREGILELFDPERSRVDMICRMNFALGLFYAECVMKLLEEAGLEAEDIDLIGSHGQTIYHEPEVRDVHGYRTRSTLQIGELAMIAERTGITTVGDFRKRDVAAGGEGAPLSAYMDYILHRHREHSRVLQNVGGIANLTYIPAGASPADVIAFDTGPGNMVIDAIVEHYTNGALHYDEDGRIAARGRVNELLLQRLLEDPYYKREPPKTTGRERFGRSYALRLIEEAEKRGLAFEDLVATATALTVETIAKAYNMFILPRGAIDEIYVSGGGARNKTLMDWLRERMKGIRISEYDVLGISSEAKEAVLMALLANEHIFGNPSNLRSATGAGREVVLGVLVPGTP